MYCSKCGKEISDDSVFCYLCGSKIDYIKSKENIEKDAIPTFNKDSSTIIQDTEKEKQDTLPDTTPKINNINATPEAQDTTREINDYKSDETKSIQYGVIFRRLLSLMIDMVGLGFVLFIIDVTIGEIIKDPLISIIGFIFFILYFSLMDCSSRQGTFGKIITGLIVSDINGNRISFPKSIIRTIIKFVHIILVFMIIGWINANKKDGSISMGGAVQGIINSLLSCSLFISVFITKRKQLLHDFIVDTVVFRKTNKF